MGFRYVLHQLANVQYRIIAPLSRFPFVAFKALAIRDATPPGVTPDTPALDAAGAEAANLPDCCTSDSCGKPMQRAAGRPSGWHEGPFADGLLSCAPHIRALTADLERLHKRSRDQNPVGAPTPLTIENLCVAAGLKSWELAHRQRGGEIPEGLTSQKLIEAGADTRRTRKRVRQMTAGEGPHNLAVASLAWNMYYNSAVKEWAEDQEEAAIATSSKRVRQRKAVTMDRAKTQGRGEAFAAKRQELKEEWGRSEHVRTLWIFRAEAEHARKAAIRGMQAEFSENAPVRKAQKLSPEETLWGCGTHDSPCSTGLLEEAAQRFHPGTCTAMFPNRKTALGPTVAAENLKATNAAHYMVSDPRPKTSKLPPLYRKPLCFMSHPGLCKTCDLAWWAVTTRICQNLNTITTNLRTCDTIGNDFWMRAVVVADDGEEEELEERVVVAECRYAKPPMQVVLPVLWSPSSGHSLMVGSNGLLQMSFSYQWVKEFVAEWLCQGQPSRIVQIREVTVELQRCRWPHVVGLSNWFLFFFVASPYVCLVIRKQVLSDGNLRPAEHRGFPRE